MRLCRQNPPSSPPLLQRPQEASALSHILLGSNQGREPHTLAGSNPTLMREDKPEGSGLEVGSLGPTVHPTLPAQDSSQTQLTAGTPSVHSCRGATLRGVPPSPLFHFHADHVCSQVKSS